MTTVLSFLAAAMPPEIAGLPTWALNGLSIGSLVTFVLVGLGTSRLWTKRQVDELVKQHEAERKRTETDHQREMVNLTARYDTHLARTVKILTERCDDALAREKEWRDTAISLQQAVTTLADGVGDLQDQGEGMLRIVTAWQNEYRRKDSQ